MNLGGFKKKLPKDKNRDLEIMYFVFFVFYFTKNIVHVFRVQDF